jgi:hypothetical protein
LKEQTGKKPIFAKRVLGFFQIPATKAAESIERTVTMVEQARY